MKQLLDIAATGVSVPNPGYTGSGMSYEQTPRFIKNGPNSEEAQQARVMRDEVMNPMIARTRLIEEDFNIAVGSDPRGRGIGRSIMTPDQLEAQTQAWRKGGYYDQHIGVQGGERGRFAYLMPKIGAQADKARHMGRFMEGSFRQPTVNTQAKDYEIEQFGDWEGLYGGQSAIGGEEAVDTGLQFRQDEYDQYWDDYKERRGEELTQAEEDLTNKTQEERSQFLNELADAESSWTSHSERFKDLPSQTRGGIRGPLTPEDWGMPSEGEELVA
tara:strand:- start:118 stop:933 length:816 start_codon:yes stop_codon:yes gene_type:complete